MSIVKRMPVYPYLLLLLLPAPSYAHVRWFSDQAVANAYLPFDAISVIMAALVIVPCLLLIPVAWSSSIGNLVNKLYVERIHLFWYLLLAAICIYLLANLLMGDFLAPNLILPPSLALYGLLLQSAVLVLLPISVSLVGIALCLVATLLLMVFDIGLGIDYFFEFFGVGLALVFIGPSVSLVDTKLALNLNLEAHGLRKKAVTCLRWGLGLQLVVLAVHNKFLEPSISFAFLQQFPEFNFFPLLGFSSITDGHFVLWVGLAEAVLGVMLIAGLATRLVILVLAVVLTITALLLGMHEVLGHLPIFAVALVILFESPKQRLSGNAVLDPQVA
ncbi:hypothetical protein [Aliagarivorans taiwanensis]|uniref:hypothetical protein n=1 Tax=Aliagarivorans taiwanensis TaxID=561966 RepID=UPI0003FFC597|nr:hypothetical protein [Aliagarivorans taiwanensis]